jgi:hypothetical protein
MASTLWFDMDGTIYPLYRQAGWLEALESEDATIFERAAFRKSLPQIRAAVRALIENGWRVGVITWAPKYVTPDQDFFWKVVDAKRAWLNYYFPEINMDDFFCLEYGTPKAEIIPHNDENMNVLVDDNIIVRKMWRECGVNYIAIDANKGFTKTLEGLAM